MCGKWFISLDENIICDNVIVVFVLRFWFFVCFDCCCCYCFPIFRTYTCVHMYVLAYICLFFYFPLRGPVGKSTPEFSTIDQWSRQCICLPLLSNKNDFHLATLKRNQIYLSTLLLGKTTTRLIAKKEKKIHRQPKRQRRQVPRYRF